MDVRKKELHLLIVDKNPTVRLALESRLQLFSELIVCTFGSVDDAVKYMPKSCPDVILLSASDHLAEQVALLRENDTGENAGIIVLATYANEWEESTALEAGANRYLLKKIDTEQLLAEIYTL